MKNRLAITLLLFMVLMDAGVQTSVAQSSDSRLYQRGWYAGLGGGGAFGQATFRSITESRTSVGGQFGAYGGYQLSRLLSVEVLATMGRQTQTSLACDPYWLSADGYRSLVPALGMQGNYYRDLEARTRWVRLALQADIDVLSLITRPTTRWTLTLSPQVSAVTTRTAHYAAGYEQGFSRQWHLGLGGQAAVGYRVARSVGLQLYGGITCLTGQRFDNIPEHFHKSNLIYEAGLRVAYHFGASSDEAQVADASVAIGDAATSDDGQLKARDHAVDGPANAGPETQPEERNVAEDKKEADENNIAEEKKVADENPALVVEEITQPAEEKAAPEEDAQPAEENGGAQAVALPAIYFAHDSHRLRQREADKLDAVADMMKAHPDMTLGIIGHASNTGSRTYNLRLTQRRANTVKMLLVRRGIAASRLFPVVGKGIDYEAATSKDARRVDLIINDK